MAPSPIPAPLPPWARFLIQLAPLIALGLQDALQYIGTMQHIQDPVPDHWMRLALEFDNVTSTDNADKMFTTMDVVNITNGKIDSTWTDDDFTNVWTPLDNYVRNTYLAHCSNQVRFQGVRFYPMQFNPLTIDKPFAPSGPPVKTFGDGSIGTVTASYQAPQIAISTTDKTPYPRHWGRNYWPGIAPNQLKGDGHWVAATCDVLASGLGGVYAAWGAAEFFPVVTVTQVQGAAARGLLGVTQVQVDDVPDVIRRRRPHLTTHRAVFP